MILMHNLVTWCFCCGIPRLILVQDQTPVCRKIELLFVASPFRRQETYFSHGNLLSLFQYLFHMNDIIDGNVGGAEKLKDMFALEITQCLQIAGIRATNMVGDCRQLQDLGCHQ